MQLNLLVIIDILLSDNRICAFRIVYKTLNDYYLRRCWNGVVRKMMASNFFREQFDCLESFEHITQKEVDLEVIQISPGPFNHFHRMLFLSDIHIGHRTVESACLHRGSNQSNIYLFSVPTSNSCIVNGNVINPFEISITTPNQEFTSKCPIHFDFYFIAISKTSILKYLSEQDIQLLNTKAESLNNFMTKQINYYDLEKSLRDLVMFLLSNHDWLPELSLSDIEEKIIRLLISMIKPGLSQEIELKKSTRYSVIERAMDYIDQHTDSPNIKIADLTKQSFCSIRTLEYSFKSVLGISPKQYLTLRRMHLIRKRLITDNSTTIQQLVQSYGIVNAGRFSSDYFKLFGEYPKQTASRMHKKNKPKVF